MTVSGAKFWKPVLLAAAAAIFVAVLGATVTDTGPWYQSLKKPSWQPPDWLFGPAWTLIYSLTAAAGVLAWRSTTDRASRDLLLAAFAANGFLNVLWSVLFFKLRRPDLALYEVSLLWLSIVVLIVLCRKSSSLAAWLLVPYLLWVSFAAFLNFTVVRLNGL